jgi:hypothetical protein
MAVELVTPERREQLRNGSFNRPKLRNSPWREGAEFTVVGYTFAHCTWVNAQGQPQEDDIFVLCLQCGVRQAELYLNTVCGDIYSANGDLVTRASNAFGDALVGIVAQATSYDDLYGRCQAVVNGHRLVCHRCTEYSDSGETKKAVSLNIE